MARTNIYIKDSVYEEIKNIVKEKSHEGISHAECNISNTCSKFIEDGLMLYKAQMKNKTSYETDPINFRKELIKNITENRVYSQKIIGMLSLIPDVAGKFPLEKIQPDAEGETDRIMKKLFS